MNDERSAPVQRCIGRVQSLCYLLDEPTATLTIQSDGQAITARAYGQVALDLRVLLGGATICVTLHCAPPDCPQVIAFSVVSDDGMNDPNAQHRDGEVLSVPVSCGHYTRPCCAAPPDFSLPRCKHLIHAHAEAVEQP